jgi:peptidyl-tRNA hydrolase, PTH1 family
LLDLLGRLLREPAPEPGTRHIVCLGNPGSQYSTTRHNVGWWLADRAATEWGLGRFRKEGVASVARGEVAGHRVQLTKPLTYMNRSAEAVAPLLRQEGLVVERDLLVVVDDVALPPGRARIRAGGSAGGHNGLRSLEALLGSGEYPRLRIGVGAAPPGEDLADWVLSSPPPEDRRLIMELFPELVESLRIWIQEGIEPAMNRTNSAGRGEAGR